MIETLGRILDRHLTKVSEPDRPQHLGRLRLMKLALDMPCEIRSRGPREFCLEAPVTVERGSHGSFVAKSRQRPIAASILDPMTPSRAYRHTRQAVSTVYSSGGL